MTPEFEKRIKLERAGKVPTGYKKTKVGIVPKEWAEVRFRDMFSRLTRKNKEGNTNVLTISAQRGLINQNEFFNKTVASDDKTNYFLLNKGEFAYNKSCSSGYPVGALKRLDYYEKGVVSPLYICFSAKETNRCPDFFVHYFEAGLMNREIQAFAQEGARNHGLLNIAVEDFFNSNLICPPIGEQKKIADILATQDKVIELKEKLIAEKRKQKCFIMSFLFPKGMLNKRLSDICENLTKRVASGRSCYISTENMVSYYGGVIFGENKQCVDGIAFKKDDILVANIRPYLKKVWRATLDGTCSADVLVFRGKNVDSFFLYYLIANDNYVDYVMSGVKGTKMPRGDKKYIMQMPICVPSLPKQQSIGKILSSVDEEISLLQKELELEKLKKKSLMQLLLTGLVRVGA